MSAAVEREDRRYDPLGTLAGYSLDELDRAYELMQHILTPAEAEASLTRIVERLAWSHAKGRTHLVGTYIGSVTDCRPLREIADDLPSQPQPMIGVFNMWAINGWLALQRADQQR